MAVLAAPGAFRLARVAERSPGGGVGVVDDCRAARDPGVAVAQAPVQFAPVAAGSAVAGRGHVGYFTDAGARGRSAELVTGGREHAVVPVRAEPGAAAPSRPVALAEEETAGFEASAPHVAGSGPLPAGPARGAFGALGAGRPVRAVAPAFGTGVNVGERGLRAADHAHAVGRRPGGEGSPALEGHLLEAHGGQPIEQQALRAPHEAGWFGRCAFGLPGRGIEIAVDRDLLRARELQTFVFTVGEEELERAGHALSASDFFFPAFEQRFDPVDRPIRRLLGATAGLPRAAM